jgi:hypothetical protein
MKQNIDNYPDVVWLEQDTILDRMLPCNEGQGAEYHLAPVWHDAKEPPKEEGNFLALIVIENSPPYITIEHNSLGCKLHSYIKYWMPLPLPPERSGE